MNLLQGPYGYAESIPVRPETPDQEATLCLWLLSLQATPHDQVLSRYLLSLIHLRDAPDLAPAARDYPEAEYELAVFTLNPKHREKLVPEFLNLRIQFHGVTDEQAKAITRKAVRGCLEGVLSVAPDLIPGMRERWFATVRETVDLFRQPCHC